MATETKGYKTVGQLITELKKHSKNDVVCVIELDESNARIKPAELYIAEGFVASPISFQRARKLR